MTWRDTAKEVLEVGTMLRRHRPTHRKRINGRPEMRPIRRVMAIRQPAGKTQQAQWSLPDYRRDQEANRRFASRPYHVCDIVTRDRGLVAQRILIDRPAVPHG